MESTEEVKAGGVKSHTPRSSILKTSVHGQESFGHGGSESEHVKFDEVIIAEHDKDRGTRTKILEPKTPYEADEPMSLVEGKEDVEMHESAGTDAKQVDEEIRYHLEEAERNKTLNAQFLHQQAEASGAMA